MGEKVGLYLGINSIQLVNPIIYISFFLLHSTIYKGFPGGSDGILSACNVGDLGSIPGLGRPLGEGNGNPLQYSCLKNSID